MNFDVSINASHYADLLLYQNKPSLLINEKVVSSLATCVLKRSEILLPVLFRSATESPRNKCLALAVLLRVLQEALEGMSKRSLLQFAVFCLSLEIYATVRRLCFLFPKVADVRVFSFADCTLVVVKASLPWLREQLAVLESEQGFDVKNAAFQKVLLVCREFLKNTLIMALHLHMII